VRGGGEVSSVVIKHFWDDPVRGLDDWAALVFLTHRGLYLAPRLLAGSLEARLLVMEDLGQSESLEALLQGQSIRTAISVLMATVRLTALLHVRTLSAQSDYDAVRQSIEPRHERVRIENARYLVDNAG